MITIEIPATVFSLRRATEKQDGYDHLFLDPSGFAVAGTGQALFYCPLEGVAALPGPLFVCWPEKITFNPKVPAFLERDDAGSMTWRQGAVIEQAKVPENPRYRDTIAAEWAALVRRDSDGSHFSGSVRLSSDLLKVCQGISRDLHKAAGVHKSVTDAIGLAVGKSPRDGTRVCLGRPYGDKVIGFLMPVGMIDSVADMLPINPERSADLKRMAELEKENVSLNSELYGKKALLAAYEESITALKAELRELRAQLGKVAA